VFHSVEKFPRHYAGQVADLESSDPEVGFRVIDLIQVRHEAFSTARTANPKKFSLLQDNLMLHNLLALQAKIVENETFSGLQFPVLPLRLLQSA
jgi:hypothetical protein